VVKVKVKQITIWNGGSIIQVSESPCMEMQNSIKQELPGHKEG
jgi:hypothetical protein